jgi:Zn-dependent protease
MKIKKEIFVILGAILVLLVSVSLRRLNLFFGILLSMFIILTINIVVKKITAYYLGAKLETNVWEIRNIIKRKNKHTTNLFPIGAILPLVTSLITFGYFVWLAPLTFEVKPKVHRSSKKVGLYKFSEMTEDHLGLIAASGIIANLILAIGGYFIGFETFSVINIYFAFFNMIPISNLDGNKIFFGNSLIWITLSILTLIGVAFSLLLI